VLFSEFHIGRFCLKLFPIKNVQKQRDAFSPLFFNFAVEYAVRRVHLYQEGLKLKGAHQVSVCADISILGGSVHTVTRDTEALGTGIEINTDKS
jgi:hypothetical protein